MNATKDFVMMALRSWWDSGKNVLKSRVVIWKNDVLFFNHQ
jgi:hypothetical protein